MRKGLFLLIFFCVCNPLFRPMSQMKFNNLGLDKIGIGQSILTIPGANEYKYYEKKDKYDIQLDTQNLYYLPRKYLDSLCDSVSLIDLFFFTDENKNILFISVFLQTDAMSLVKRITKDFGAMHLVTSSSISRVELRKRYFWLTNALITFVLTVYNIDKAIQQRDYIHLMMYQKSEKDNIGEWYIIPNFPNE